MRRRRWLDPHLTICLLVLATCTGADDGGVVIDPLPEVRPLLLVVNKSEGTLSIIDPATRTELRRVPTGFMPHEVTASPDGRTAYVTDYGSGPSPGNTVTVIDLVAGRAIRTISLGSHTRPHGIVWEATEGRLWVTTEGSAHIVAIDPQTASIDRVIRTDQEITHMVAAVPARRLLVTTNIGSNNATVVDALADRVVAHVPTGAGAEGIDVAPNGRFAYVTNRADGTLTEFDVTSQEVTRTLNVGLFPIRVKVRPSGGELLVTNASGNEVVAVDLETWTVVRRLATGAVPIGLLITPDDRTAYVASTQNDRIDIVDLAQWRIIGALAVGTEPDGLAWVQ